MADNALKTHLAIALDNIARSRAADLMQQQGRELPGHVTKIEGQIVTIAFDVNAPYPLQEVSMPIDTGVMQWLPIQVGDKGVVRSADVYLGGVSGLGGGTADLLRKSNLSMLIFHPTSNKDWRPPGGAAQDDHVIRNNSKGSGGVMLVTLDSNGNVKTKAFLDNAGTMTVTGDLHVTGAVIAGYGGSDQVGLQTHRHPQPNDSAGDVEADTDAPRPGT